MDLEIIGEATTGNPPGWTRTSDIFGSHNRTDLDSYLALIRRKIQEKCATTQDLIQQIRRNKIGDSGHVTPNEFRYVATNPGAFDYVYSIFILHATYMYLTHFFAFTTSSTKQIHFDQVRCYLASASG